MRLIKTFILRFYTDLEVRDQICGDLQPLPGRKTFPFKNKIELMDRITELVSKEANDPQLNQPQNENDPDRAGPKPPAKL